MDNPPKNQRFERSPILIVILLLVLGFTGFIYLQRLSLDKVKTNLPEKKISAVPSCEFGDINFCRYIDASAKVRDSKAHSILKSKNGNTIESFFENSGNNFTYSSREDGVDKVAIVKLDNTTYTKNFVRDNWQKEVKKTDDFGKQENVNGNFAFNIKELNQRGVKESGKKMFKAMGNDLCGKLTCYKYQLITIGKENELSYIWFDNKDFLLRKQQSQLSDGSEFSINYSYEKVSIEAPL